jgi:hypothetical protein
MLKVISKEAFAHKFMCEEDYKIFNQSDVDDLRAILEYHKPYKELMRMVRSGHFK